MKSKNQTIDVDDEKRFDDLVKLHKEIKKFKKDESASILLNFHVGDFKVQCGDDTPKPYQKVQLNKLVGRDYELQLNLSSTAVCAYVLSQYSDIWDDEKSKGRLGKITKYYEFIIDGLEKCTSDVTCIALPDNCKKPSTDSETELEPIDEFSLLNILALLKNIKDANGEELIDDGKRGIILEIIRILCKQFVMNEIPGLSAGKEKHPFIFYKFLLMVRDWNDDICKDIAKDIKDGNKWSDANTEEDKLKLKNFVDCVKKCGMECEIVFNCFFDEIYNDAKYELYRQLSLHQASDSPLFDVKRLIYALLIVKMNDRYSNDLIKKEVLDLIFKIQYTTTGLLPICHGVNSDFYIKGGEVKEEYKEGVIVSGSPVLSSVECLSDMLGHEDIELNDEYYEKLKVTYDWISNRIIKEGGTKVGWYPEYERDRTPKSWTTGHTLIFLKRYCGGVSKLIERDASKSVSAEDSTDFIDWGELADSYGFKKIIEKYMLNKIDEEKGLNYRSMILFGPPGSGKSTVGKALAKELKWGYVEVTPGLFLDEGNHKIISKINRVFKRLVRLRNKVIFFDEVDQLVKKREEGEEQSKWIVTSILPKLQELRDHDNIIFILATNGSVAKVDAAIRRLGRIDLVLPVGAISWRSRLRMLEEKMEWAEKEDKVKDYQAIKKAFEEIYKETYLGDVNTTSVKEENLNKDAILEELKKTFENGEYKLSENATIRKEKDNRWEIIDEDKIYIVKKEDETLKVYNGNTIKDHISTELEHYLRRTNFIPFVQINRVLEEMFSGDYPNFYRIFFEGVSDEESTGFVDTEFEEFVKTVDKSKSYFRPPWRVDLEKHIKDNQVK